MTVISSTSIESFFRVLTTLKDIFVLTCEKDGSEGYEEDADDPQTDLLAECVASRHSASSLLSLPKFGGFFSNKCFPESLC